jgi:DNA-binding beta-propeller fold protein YncE
VDTSRGFSRAFEVSQDGNTIYWAGYTNHAIYKYTRPDEFSAFAVTDTLLKGFDCESFAWDPFGILWLSSGSFNDLPNRYAGVATTWKPNTWYGYNPATNQVIDFIEWQFNTPANPNERPRGIAFSPDGMTAYVTCFGASDYPAIQKFTRVSTSVEGKESNWAYVETFQLFQNYPNPFNPQTTIPFDLKNPGQVQIKVFDMMGREVATLVDKFMPAGSHNLVFDARGLASGTYYYRLIFGGQTLTKRMLFEI